MARIPHTDLQDGGLQVYDVDPRELDRMTCGGSLFVGTLCWSLDKRSADMDGIYVVVGSNTRFGGYTTVCALSYHYDLYGAFESAAALACGAYRNAWRHGSGVEIEIWRVRENAYVDMETVDVEFYDIQISALCDLCEAGSDYPYAGLGHFPGCPLDDGNEWLLVDRLDGQQPFMLCSSHDKSQLEKIATHIKTKDGKTVEWEIWHVVPDVPQQDEVNKILSALRMEMYTYEEIIDCGYVPCEGAVM